MIRRRWIAAVALLLVGAALPLAAQVFLPGSVTPPPPVPIQETFTGAIVKKTGVAEKDVEAVLKALGPAIAERLAQGKGFELQGVGGFRLIRIVEHRDLIGRTAVVVPARNTIQFEPTGAFDAILNAPGAAAGVPVGLPDFNPETNRVPSGRVEFGRVGSTRVPGVRERE